VLYVYVLVACSLKSKFRWHCLVDYWVCYCMFRSMGTKVFPRVACSRPDGWECYQLASKHEWFLWSGLPRPQDGRGIITVWYQSLGSTLILDGPEGCNRSEYSQKSNFKVTRIRVIKCPWKRLVYWCAW
jgi:hypothetical protein